MEAPTKVLEIELGIKEPTYKDKIRKAREILERGYSVRLQLKLRGKEKKEQKVNGMEIIHRFIDDLELESYSVKSIVNGDDIYSVVLKG